MVTILSRFLLDHVPEIESESVLKEDSTWIILLYPYQLVDARTFRLDACVLPPQLKMTFQKIISSLSAESVVALTVRTSTS
jgi:hypothetical protein